MFCTVEDIPESERQRIANLSESELKAEWDEWCKANSAAIEEQMANESFIAYCKNFDPASVDSAQLIKGEEDPFGKLRARKGLVEHSLDSVPAGGSEVLVPLRGSYEFEIVTVPIDPNKDNYAS